jgi:hypothetical protein
VVSIIVASTASARFMVALLAACPRETTGVVVCQWRDLCFAKAYHIGYVHQDTIPKK